MQYTKVPITFIGKKSPIKHVSLSLLTGLIFAGIFSFGVYTFAVGPFAPGDTLDPGCAPTDSGCLVTGSVTYTGATAALNLGSQNFTTTGIVTGGTLKVGTAYTFPTADGTADYVLSTDGAGTVSWVAQSGGGGGGTPGGSDTQIQFNDSSAFGGDAGLVYNKTTNALSIIAGSISATNNTGATSPTAIFTNTANNTSLEVVRFIGDKNAGNGATNDEAYNSYYLTNSVGDSMEFARMTWIANVADDGSEMTEMEISMMIQGSFQPYLHFGNNDVSPLVSDVSLGGASPWSYLYIDEDGGIDFGSGDISIVRESGSDALYFTEASGGYVFDNTIKLLEGGGSPQYYTTFTSGNQSADINYTLPTGYPASSGYVLSSTTGGTMSWVDNGGSTAPRVVSIASDDAPTPNADTTDIYIVTALAEAATFGAPTGTPVQGQKLTIRIKDDGTARALAFNAIYREGTDLTLPTTTVISKTMYLGFIYNSTDTKWDLVAFIDGI